LAERDAVERPAVGARHVAQLLFRLRERGVDAGLAVAGPFEEELQGERGLARAGIPLDEIHPVRGKPPAEDVVEAFYTRRGSGKALKISIGHRLRLERPKRTPLPDTPLCRHLWRRGGASHELQFRCLENGVFRKGVPFEALTTPALLSPRERREKRRLRSSFSWSCSPLSLWER